MENKHLVQGQENRRLANDDNESTYQTHGTMGDAAIQWALVDQTVRSVANQMRQRQTRPAGNNTTDSFRSAMVRCLHIVRKQRRFYGGFVSVLQNEKATKGPMAFDQE